MEYELKARQSTKYRNVTLVAIVLALVFLALFITFLCLYLTNKDTTTSTTVATTTPMSTTVPPPVDANWMYMLPKTAKPSSYVIYQQIDLPQSMGQQGTFSGNVTINATVISDTMNITMNLKPEFLNVTSWLLVNAREIQFTQNMSIDGTHQTVTFYLNSMLYVGESITIVLQYSGVLRQDAGGLYQSSYQEYNKTKFVAVTQMESLDARSAIPCFDEPSYKAIFQLNLIHQTGLMALGNMKSSSSMDLANGYTMTSFNPTPQMSTYLLAYFVGDFACTPPVTSATIKQTQIRVCGRKSLITNSSTDLALQYGSNGLAFFENYFGVPFPLDKTDLLALPEFAAGAMENWGLITYRERYLLYDPSTAPKTATQGVLTVIVHELAHMWFGDLVTMRWWNDLWLNEAFATLMEDICGDGITDNSMQLTQQAAYLQVQPSMRTDQLPKSHPINYPVYTESQINGMFDDITYEKGSSILKQLMNSLTGTDGNGNPCPVKSQDIFNQGITSYLTSLSYQNADHFDLFYYLDKAYNSTNCTRLLNQLPVTDFMNRWINQLGFPVLLVNTDQNGMISVQQNIFQLLNNTGNYTLPPSAYQYQWNFQISTMSASNSNNVNQFLPANSSWVPVSNANSISDDWYIISGGYFRVLYPNDNFLNISAYLAQSGNLDASTFPVQASIRSQIIDDLTTIVRSDVSGSLNYNVVFQYLCYVPQTEQNEIVWRTLMADLEYIAQMLGTGNLTTMNYYYNYTIYNEWPSVQSNNYDNSVLYFYKQAAIWNQAVRSNVQDSVNQSSDYFADYATNVNATADTMSSDPKANSIPPNLRPAVYCSNLLNVDSDTAWANYQLLLDKYVIEIVNNERTSLLYGMACAKDQAVINDFLNQSCLSTGVVAPDQRGYVFGYLQDNPYAGPYMWTFMSTNWDTLYNSPLKMSGINSVIRGATANMNTPQQLAEVQAFVNQHQNDAEGFPLQYFEQAIDQIQINIDWVNKNLATVVQAMSNIMTICQ